MNKNYKKHIIFFGLLVFLTPFFAHASDSADDFKIFYDQTAFTSEARLKVATSTDGENLPAGWQKLSEVYQYSFETDGVYDPSRLLTLKINYPEENNLLKQIFIFDEIARSWQPLKTQEFTEDNYVSATINSMTGKVAIFFRPNVLISGKASWYKYKNGLFAASPDFTKGSVIRVYNLSNQKYVDVAVNDFGPERNKFPDRVIDLDAEAFKKIAPLGAGIISVKIEPIKATLIGEKQTEPVVKKDKKNEELSISASSAIIMLEKNNKVIWNKNEKNISPLASLTKLAALKVYLETKPNLEKVVSYKSQDQKFNNLYCPAGEESSLKIKDGDTLRIKDLVYSSVVGSTNNTIETLVRISGLSRDKFVAKMNQTVKDWGAKQTKFVEPTGLSPDNVSSPYDYAIISKMALSDDFLKKVSVTKSYNFKTVNTRRAFTVINTNRLLDKNSHEIVGSKTGYLDEAGYCLMTMVKTTQGNLIVVNFNSRTRAENFSDNEKLINYGLSLLKK